MQTSGGAALFVKTPGLSPVKTRLAARIGEPAATAFHLASSQSVASMLLQAAQATRLSPYFAVAEAEAMQSSCEAAACWHALPRLFQGEGSLGHRLHAIYSQVIDLHGFALAFGADAPQVQAEDFLSAAAWLADSKQPRFVLGPAADGGFWVFGGNRTLPESLWTSVEYSRADTGAHLLTRIRPLGEVMLLKTHHDVDEYDDLPVLAQALARLDHPTPAQKKLIDLVQRILGDALPASPQGGG